MAAPVTTAWLRRLVLHGKEVRACEALLRPRPPAEQKFRLRLTSSAGTAVGAFTAFLRVSPEGGREGERGGGRGREGGEGRKEGKGGREGGRQGGSRGREAITMTMMSLSALLVSGKCVLRSYHYTGKIWQGLHTIKDNLLLVM